MRLADILKESSVIADITGKTKKDILSELVGQLGKNGLIKDTGYATTVVMDRESLGSTGIGDGVAIPHGKMKYIDNILCAFGRSVGGVDFDAADRQPVHIFFLVLAPEDSASAHLTVLSRISRLLRDQSFRKKLIGLPDAHAVYKCIVEEDDKL